MDKGRVLLRNPQAPGWTPDGVAGEPTKSERVARQWEEAYIAEWDRLAARVHLGIDALDRETAALMQPLRPALEAFAATRARQGLALSTLQGDETAWRQLRKWYGDTTPLAAIRADPKPGERANYTSLGDRFRAMLAEGYEIGTCTVTLGKVQMFLRAHGITAADGIVLTSRSARHNTKRKTAWTGEEVEVVRKAADEIDAGAGPRKQFPFSHRLAVELGLGTGLRIGEMFAVTWTDFLYPASRRVHVREQWNFRERRLTVPKSGHDRLSFVLPSWWAFHQPTLGRRLVLADRDGRQVSGDIARFLATRVLEHAGIKRDGESAHMLRHTYARLFLQGGGTLYQLKNSLGHEKLETTEQYYDHYATESLDDLEAKFYPDSHPARRIA